MQVYDLDTMTAHPYAERSKNVLYGTDNFKLRIIELAAGGEIPPCEMTSHVVFYVIWILIVVFVLPFLLGLAFGIIVEAGKLQNWLDRLGISIASRTSQTWDYFFSKKERCWLIAYLDSGEIARFYQLILRLLKTE